MKRTDFDVEWDSLSDQQRDNFMLVLMAEWAIDELRSTLRREPKPKEIFDHLFKGNRQYEDVRRQERQLKEIFARMGAKSAKKKAT